MNRVKPIQMIYVRSRVPFSKFCMRTCHSESIVSPHPKKQEKFCLRKNAPAFMKQDELLTTPIENESLKRNMDLKLLGMYTLGGLGLVGTLSFISIPYGIAVGTYFTVVEGYLAQLRKSYFGSAIGNCTDDSHVSKVYERLINLMLITNAQICIEKWKDDLLDDYNPLIESLNGYTALQNLVVKEPIIDRAMKPRVVSGVSTKIIWDNLIRESLFFANAKNPWEDQIPGLRGKYLKLFRPSMSKEDKPYIPKRYPDSSLSTFELFYEDFYNVALNEMLSHTNLPSTSLKSAFTVLFTGGILCLPILIVTL